MEIERKLTEHIQKFLLELGQGFAFAGRQMKLMLACAFSYDAELLILDEPTSSLDPVSGDNPALTAIASSPVLLIVFAIVLAAVMYAVSIWFSIQIMESKEKLVKAINACSTPESSPHNPWHAEADSGFSGRWRWWW